VGHRSGVSGTASLSQSFRVQSQMDETNAHALQVQRSIDFGVQCIRFSSVCSDFVCDCLRRQWLRSTQTAQTRPAAVPNGARIRKARKSGGKATGGANAGTTSLEPEPAADAGKARNAASSAAASPATPSPPPLRKQRSRGRGQSSTEGDAGSTASSAGGLPPDTPAQGRRPLARHAREDTSSPDDSPRSSASGSSSAQPSAGRQRSPFAVASPAATAALAFGAAPREPPPLPGESAQRAAKPAPNIRPAAVGPQPKAARPARHISAAVAVRPATVSRTADLPAADRPVKGTRRQPQHAPQPPPPCAAAPPEVAGITAARPLAPRAPAFEPRSRSPLGQAAGCGGQPPPPPRQRGHPPSPSGPPPQQWWAPPQQLHPQPAQATSPSDDIDDILADAWALTSESVPPQRPPLAHHDPGGAGFQLPVAAAAFQQQPGRAAAAAAAAGPLPGLRPISRTISSASSDTTAASLPPHAPPHQAPADGRSLIPRGSFNTELYGFVTGASLADSVLDWDGRRSASASPAPAPSLEAASASSADVLPRSFSPTPAAAAVGGGGGSMLGEPDAPLLALLPEDLLSSSAAADAATTAAGDSPHRPPLGRAAGSGPLLQEPWPPAHADAPGMRARLGLHAGSPAGGFSAASGALLRSSPLAGTQQRGAQHAFAATLPQLVLPGAAASLPAPGSPHALSPSAAAAQYNLWGSRVTAAVPGPASPLSGTESPFTSRPLLPPAGAAPGGPFARLSAPAAATSLSSLRPNSPAFVPSSARLAGPGSAGGSQEG